MTEYDRGAYTPHADAPLAFDPRSPRERRPMPMTLVASGAILAVLCAAVVMAYRHHGGLGGEPRTVGAPVGAVKTVAAADAAPRDPAATLDVYAPQNVTAAPAFAPAPEEPAPRPAPRVQVQPAADTPVRIETPPAAATPATSRAEMAAPRAPAAANAAPATAIVRGAADAETRTIAPPAAGPQAVAAAPAAKTAAAPVAERPFATARAQGHAGAMTVASIRETDATIDAALARSAHPAAAKPKPTTSVAATPAAAKGRAAASVTTLARAEARPATAVKAAAAAATPASGKVVVQIGAYNSTAIADAQFAAAKAAVGGGHGKAVSPVVVGGKTLYRTAFTGFADKAAAKAFCGRLTAAGHACIVKG